MIHSHFLHEGVSKNNAEALEFENLVWLESVGLQRAYGAQLSRGGLVFLLRFFVAEVTLDYGPDRAF